MVHFTYDKKADAAYIYFADKPIKAKKTIQTEKNVFLDFDAKDKLVGMEILNASKMMNKKSLKI